MSEEALKIAEERTEAKGKGERERYTQLNAEFKRLDWYVDAGLTGPLHLPRLRLLILTIIITEFLTI